MTEKYREALEALLQIEVLLSGIDSESFLTTAESNILKIVKTWRENNVPDIYGK